MAKAGPDVYGGENQGGYSSDNSSIYGFSHMHDSGTGGKLISSTLPSALC
jgi:putative alpha-1,2-mannosidase